MKVLLAMFCFRNNGVQRTRDTCGKWNWPVMDGQLRNVSLSRLSWKLVVRQFVLDS